MIESEGSGECHHREGGCCDQQIEEQESERQSREAAFAGPGHAVYIGKQ